MKKIGAIALSLFIFIASINIVVNQHFCNDELESIAFFIKAQPCEHATASNDLPPCHAKKVKDQKKCCSENSIVIKSVDWVKIIGKDIKEIKPLINLPILENVLVEHSHTKIEEYSSQKIPKPPDEEESEEVFIFHQAFLL